MSGLFEPTEINGMKLRNRFVRSATYEAMAEADGTVKDQLVKHMAELVRGGVGLIITGHSHVTLDNGFTVAEMIKVAYMLEELGLDAIEMSGGTFASGSLIPSRVGTSTSEEKEVYYKEAARAFKKEIGIPLILVGGFLSFTSAEDAVSSEFADFVALSRPLIREPQLVKRWENGDRRKATCISCNKCFATLFTKEALHCAVERE